MPVSPPCPPLGRVILPRGSFSRLFAALEHKKPRHTLQIYAIASKIFCVCVRSSPRSARAFCIRSDSACLCVPNELPYRPLACDFSAHTDKPLLGLLFFGAQVLSVVCHFDEDTSIGSVRAIHVTTNLYTLEIPCNGLIFGSSFYLTSL